MKRLILASAVITLTAGILGGCAQQNATTITWQFLTASERQAQTDSLCNSFEPSLAQQPETQGRTEVVLTRGGGTFEVPVIINGALQLNFTIDSGAAAVIIPADVMPTLRRTRNAS